MSTLFLFGAAYSDYYNYVHLVHTFMVTKYSMAYCTVYALEVSKFRFRIVSTPPHLPFSPTKLWGIENAHREWKTNMSMIYE